MAFLANEKEIAKFFKKTALNPNLSFLIYFLLVATYGFIGRELMLFYAVVAPWLVLMLLFFNMPFFRILFAGVNMSESKKINHVLEHGTIYFLKKNLGKKHKMTGKALNNGFRVGGVKSKGEIQKAFERLRKELNDNNRAIVLSKYCGSNVYFLQGASLILLTLTFIGFIMIDIDLLYVKIILLANLILHMLFRYPIGKHFQKKLTMSFDFSDATIKSIEKSKTNLLEASPVYIVQTEIFRN